MSRSITLRCAILMAAALAAHFAAAAVIDFETDPSGSPSSDNLVLSTPYPIAGGGNVQFYFDVNTNLTYDSGVDDDPIIERTGQDGTDAFTSSTTGVNDSAAAGFVAQLGNFFLRHPTPALLPPPLIADYNTAQNITGLSGEIWDIDGTPASGLYEQWRVDVLDGSNNLLASQTSPLGNSFALDSRPWVFTFTGLSNVDKLVLTFVGTKTTGFGLAFNNFNPQVVPEPGTFVLAGVGAAMLIAMRARRRRESSGNNQ